MSTPITTFEATHSILLREFYADRMKVKHQKVKGEDRPSSHVITVERLWDRKITASLVFLDDTPEVRFQLQFPLVNPGNGWPVTSSTVSSVWPFVNAWNAAGHTPKIRLLADTRKVTVILEGSVSPYEETTDKTCQEMLKELREQYHAIRKGIVSAYTHAEEPEAAVEHTHGALVSYREGLETWARVSRR